MNRIYRSHRIATLLLVVFAAACSREAESAPDAEFGEVEFPAEHGEGGEELALNTELARDGNEHGDEGEHGDVEHDEPGADHGSNEPSGGGEVDDDIALGAAG